MCENKAVIVISFGTSYKETREKTIGAIEKEFQSRFTDRKFYRAWTSGFIRKKILSPQEAAKKVLIIAAIILVVGFVLNLVIKKIRSKNN